MWMGYVRFEILVEVVGRVGYLFVLDITYLPPSYCNFG